ncbi:MAG: transcriptional repressor NrdR [Candidatus Omnitrophica bacterium]|nr:transcriptional repressor NrdR [Candidatus Omnitrophota bacterium]
MICPYCGSRDHKVIDSRSSEEGKAVRRRRECVKCERRFTTYEYVEESRLMVIKKDGRRENFDRKKLLGGIITACEKRPISTERIEKLVDDIERTIQRKYDKEVQAKEIGEVVMSKLHRLDEVAYVRFASVYRQFKDITQFMKEVKHLLK